MAKKISTALFLTRNTFDWTRLHRARSIWKCTDSGCGQIPDRNTDNDASGEDGQGNHTPATPLSGTKELLTLCAGSSNAIFKLLSLPSTDPAELHDMASLQLTKLMPLPEEEMSFSLEMISTGETDSTVMACAMPNAELDELSAAGGIRHSRILRIDSSAFAFIRNFANTGMSLPDARELVMFEEDGNLIMCVLDNGRPVIIHSAGELSAPPSDITRAIRLSMLQSEREAGPAKPKRFTIVSKSAAASVLRDIVAEKFEVETALKSPEEIGFISTGAALRSSEDLPFDLTPVNWKTSTADRKFREKLARILAVGVIAWGLLAAALYGGVPILKHRAAALESSIKMLEPHMRAVNDVRNRVRIIQMYMDRSMSALETLREVCINMPENVTLTSFRYSRMDRRLDIQGTAKSTPLVYQFKQKIDASPLFSESSLKGPTTNPKTGDAGFELKVLFRKEDDTQ